MNIVQIVPRLPPAINGVGDYAFLLARELRAAHAIGTHFVVGGSSVAEQEGYRERHAELDGFPISYLNFRRGEELARLLSTHGMPSTLLLHYVGYGYEKRGCPLWLVKGLQRWHGMRDSHRLITMFHEAYAFGPPWRSSFWTSPLQKHIARQLVRTSDHIWTNTRLFAGMLENLALPRFRKIPVLPVFSNMGEPQPLLPLSRRKSQMIVFGSAIWRRKIYGEHADALVHACRLLGLKSLVDIGESLGVEPKLPLPVLERGRLSAEQVSQILGESKAGFLTYFSDSIAKSGVFAAYCAHGLVPVLASPCEAGADGIRDACEYVSGSTMKIPLSEVQMQTVADCAQAWYRPHSLKRTAAHVAATVAELSASLSVT